MSKIVWLFFVTSLSVSAFAGIDPDMLADVLKTPEVKAALEKQEINSIKLVYDRPGKARFDYDIVVCGVSSGENGETTFVTTAIYGRFAWFKNYNDGDVETTATKTEPAVCKTP